MHMKTYSKIAFASLLALLALASCKRQETEPVEWRTKLQVVSSDLTFYPDGGQGTVELNETVSKAEPNCSWLTASVSGSKVSVSVNEWAGNQARYAMLTISSATESVKVPVIQYGEVIAGLDMADIAAPFTGTTVLYDVKLNVGLQLKADQDWIHATYEPEERLLTIVVDENPNPATRVGLLTYKAGSVSGSIDVIQNPPYVREGWELTSGEASFAYPDFLLSASSTPASQSDQYVFFSVPASQVSGDFEDWLFLTKAGQIRRDILAQAAAAGKDFKDFLVSGAYSTSFNVEPGQNYLIAVGFGENSYVTGKYQALEVTVDDVRPAYFKWAGTWSVTSGDFSEEWKISIDEDHLEESLLIDGINSITTSSVVSNKASTMVLTYNKEDGTVSLLTQKGKEFHYSDSYGTCTMQAQGRYSKSEGSYTRVSAMGVKIFSCALSADGKSATMTPGTRTSGGVEYPFVQMRLWLVRNDTGGTYSLNASSGLIPLPLEMYKTAN